MRKKNVRNFDLWFEDCNKFFFLGWEEKKIIGWRLIISGCKVKGILIVNKMLDFLRYILY